MEIAFFFHSTKTNKLYHGKSLAHDMARFRLIIKQRNVIVLIDSVTYSSMGIIETNLGLY